MTGFVDVFLRVLLIALFGACVAVQIWAGSLAAPIVGGVSGVVLVCLIVAGALCVEAVLISVWMLAGMVRDASIFDGRTRADRWTNTAIAALGLAAVFAASGFVYFLVSQTQPSHQAEAVLAVVAAAAVGVAVALALVVVVMRRLLQTAIQYQSELAEVI
ncbi:hypothetical protein B7R22_13430 [Subtercola boreus]|uniref:ABC transporter n=1 Tax=Subtercola boreus TaxID=120213 RepID=A0A3E0VWB1_9MICO|nr:DUF2975 domain-containing protein [Subtercola boreus]RFA13648.1 hypothetical protein B7R22_13430 [Subtercola boreus]